MALELHPRGSYTESFLEVDKLTNMSAQGKKSVMDDWWPGGILLGFGASPIAVCVDSDAIPVAQVLHLCFRETFEACFVVESWWSTSFDFRV